MSPTNNMKSPPNYYKLLGVPSTASTHEITRAYHKKILEVHVDKCPNKNPNLCYETIEAYRVLSNHDARTNYDIQRDRLKGFLTDRELLERYKGHLEPGQPVTPEVISSLREKYNLEREDHLETFVPAGAITYDVEDQLSSIILKRIQAWETEFEEVKSSSLRDNYFECYSSLVNKVLRPDQSTNQFWCTICDKNFLNESHHSEEILQPYLAYYRPDKQGLNVTSIYDFFHIQFGILFTWEPPYLPKTLLGIWGRPEWVEFYVIQELLRDTSAQLLPPDFFEDVAEHVKYIRSCVPEPASEFICWVLENNEETHFNKMAKTLICSGDLRDILTFIAVLSEFLGFGNWEGLCMQALDYGEIELTLFWTKVRELLGLTAPNDWLNLGMTIHCYKDDPYLSHFCFLLQGSPDWDQVATLFTADGDHLKAITYHLFSDNPSASLQTYLKLSNSDPKGAQVYRNVYYSRKVKDLLMKLVQNRNLDDLAELITIIQILFQDPTEPFKLIINIYSEYFLEPAFSPIHRNSMDYFQSLPTTFGSLKLILGALHYLEPGDDKDADEYFLASNWSRMSRRELDRSLKTSDFEKLTRCLLNMNRWSLPAAKEVLRELEDEEELSSHIRGMMLLLRGSIHKLEKNWLEATTDFQAALLNTPECLYRLTPCVSQLTQDIEYHEGVLGRVQESLMDLKCNFEEGAYIQIDTSVHSLVVTDVVPQEEFGYKDLASRIQLEPPPLREENPDIQYEREPPPVETNTPLLTLDKVERAIEVGADTNKPMDALSSALAYMDLLKALPVNLHHGPVVMAASHFLRAMNETENPRSMFAYRNAILEMADKLLALDRQVGAKVQSSLTHKHMFSIALMANQRLSQYLATPDNDFVSETKLISSDETELLEKLLKSVVGSSQVEPLANIPTLTCSDLSYVEKVKAHYLQAFCADKIQQKFQSTCIPSHVHAYALFLETWRGRCGTNNFERSRTVAMETFLAHHECTMEDMRKFMERPVDDLDGFLLEYGAIDGFKIDLATGEISFLLCRGNLFTAKEILEVFENSIKSATLSLEHPGLEFQSHPCKQVVYEPCSLASTEYFKCLLRTSMLLSTFVTGVEICANPPFGSMLAYQSLFEPLPEHLQYFLRPLQERTCETALDQFRFWISFSESYEEIEESETEFIYIVGNVQPEVISERSTSVDFAADFTRHYSEVEFYFPEFLKLKEFKKMSLIYSKLLEILNEKTDVMLRNGLGMDKNSQIAKKICESISKLGIKLDEMYENPINSAKSCVWVPSPSCHVEYPDPYEVTGGIRISGQPIYGPVSASRDSAYVPSQDLILELEYYREAIKGNQAPQYFTVTVDAGRAFEQQFFSTPSNQYIPNFDFEYGPIDGADLEAPPAWTSPTAISPGGSGKQILRLAKSQVSKQSSLPTLAEEESAEMEAEAKQLELNEETHISASISDESEFSSAETDLEVEDVITLEKYDEPDLFDTKIGEIGILREAQNIEVVGKIEIIPGSSDMKNDEAFSVFVDTEPSELVDHTDIPEIEAAGGTAEAQVMAAIQLILTEIVAAISCEEETAEKLKYNSETYVTPPGKNENTSEVDARIVSKNIESESISVPLIQEPVTVCPKPEEIAEEASSGDSPPTSVPDIHELESEIEIESEDDDVETDSIVSESESEESVELPSETESELAAIAIENKPEKFEIQQTEKKVVQEAEDFNDIESEYESESESEYSENSSVSGIHEFDHIQTQPIPCVLDGTEPDEEGTDKESGGGDDTESDISEFEGSDSDTDEYSGMHEIGTVHHAVVHVHSETQISHDKTRAAMESTVSIAIELEGQNIIPTLSKNCSETESSNTSSDSESELDSTEADLQNFNFNDPKIEAQIKQNSQQPDSDIEESEKISDPTTEVEEDLESEPIISNSTKNNDNDLHSEDTSTEELESPDDSNSEFEDENGSDLAEYSNTSKLLTKNITMDTCLPSEKKLKDDLERLPIPPFLDSTNETKNPEILNQDVSSCETSSEELMSSQSSDSELELTDELNSQQIKKNGPDQSRPDKEVISTKSPIASKTMVNPVKLNGDR